MFVGGRAGGEFEGQRTGVRLSRAVGDPVEGEPRASDTFALAETCMASADGAGHVPVVAYEPNAPVVGWHVLRGVRLHNDH